MSAAAARLVVVSDDADHQADDGLVGVLRRRLSGAYRLDAWGLDEDVTRLAGSVASVRWATTVTGIEQLPAGGPALLVANRRLGWSEPAVVASAVLRDTGRIVRPVGGVGFDPVGGFLRRLGMVPAVPDEVAAALRAGNLVLVPTRREPVRNRPGHLPIELVAAGLAVDVPLVPVGVIGWEFGRHWTVRIGEPVRLPRSARARGGGRVDPRAVGAAAVEVAAKLDDLIARGHERNLEDRVRSIVPGPGRAGRDDRGASRGD
jgi:hypothetical protein